jgi:hypothetical protein
MQIIRRNPEVSSKKGYGWKKGRVAKDDDESLYNSTLYVVYRGIESAIKQINNVQRLYLGQRS